MAGGLHDFAVNPGPAGSFVLQASASEHFFVFLLLFTDPACWQLSRAQDWATTLNENEEPLHRMAIGWKQQGDYKANASPDWWLE